jgi:hypothetical protein
MATIAVTTNLNEQIGDALLAVDATITITTSSRGLAFGTCTGYIERTHGGTSIVVYPAIGGEPYIIDFKTRRDLEVRPTWYGPEAVFPLRAVEGYRDDPRAVRLVSLREVL